MNNGSTGSTDQWTAVARMVAMAFCSFLASRGFSWLGDASVQAQIAAFLLGGGTLFWAWWSQRPAQVLRNAANVDHNMQIGVPQSVSDKNPAIQRLVDDDKHYPNVRVALNGAWPEPPITG